ncbi:non-homologous end joining protein Ku [Foetidibacter luteolus]|uniref:non-homologous end joining protein Ku n=1 Tax=Foetidibacter luteolus TaxID=2608880 RepID=UPI00129AC186|nr:Ku protein [Foetidibacter luteolus]
MRSIWTGSICFGLVNIPVKLYSAVEASELNLDMLDKKDHSHIKFKRVNESTGKEVAWANIVKAYDLNGKYVILGEEDFAKASPEKTKNIDIFQFVKLQEIDSVYFETPYYLEPDKSGTRAYALLREALRKSGMAGLGNFVLRNREHLVILKAKDNAIILNTIRFEEEIRDASNLKLPAKTSAKPNEIKMALSLIENMTATFDIKAYKDNYTAELMKLIKAKARGKTVKQPVMKVVHRQSDDLMSQLKASLSKKQKKAS